MHLAKWGNSYAIRIPRDLVEKLNVELGDELVALISYDGSLRITRKLTSEEAIEDLKRFEGLIPANFKFDREEANAR